MPGRRDVPPQELDRLAELLTGRYTVVGRCTKHRWLLRRVRKDRRLLEEAYRRLNREIEKSLLLSYGGEWLLDNFYFIRRVPLQIRSDLSSDYYRRLPKVMTTEGERPRVYCLARDLVAARGPGVELSEVSAFLRAFQRVTPLTIAELWAFPIMLRFVLLGWLMHAVIELGLSKPSHRTKRDDRVQTESFDPPGGEHGSDNEEVVSQAIRSLIRIDAHDWKRFFESISAVDRVLESDPAGIYHRMEFDTRDAYRKVVEEIGERTDLGEKEVAQAVVDLSLAAQRARPGSAPKGAGDATTGESPLGERATDHVGYYLVDHGRSRLEESLAYRPTWRQRPRRWMLAYPTPTYLGTIGILGLVLLAAAVMYARSAGSNWAQLGAVILLIATPSLAAAVALTNWLFTQIIPPRLLPKLDLRAGVPEESRGVVAVPALLTSAAEVDELVHQMERHYQSNPDSHITFALLTDFTDAPRKEMEGDGALLERVKQGIQSLNLRYGHRSRAADASGPEGGREIGDAPFFLFHRDRLWNPGEGVWMGWERKRGKLAEFNRLILGDEITSNSVRVGDFERLRGARYVITLDADTLMPPGAAHRLIGAMAHPLNRPVFDPQTGRVVSGYTVLQPRVEILPALTGSSLFSRVFAGDEGLDLYTRASADVYQDLFGEGIYVGKGIYDVAAFERSLQGKVPENAVLSHDLFEGIHGRAALASDIVVYEDYPPNYLAFTRRIHRWIRGDWQLLPWLFPRLFRAGARFSGPTASSHQRLPVIDIWKMADNLWRTLFSLSLLALFTAAWLGALPGSQWVWTIAGLCVPALLTLAGLVPLSFVRRTLATWAVLSALAVVTSAASGWLGRPGLEWSTLRPWQLLLGLGILLSTAIPHMIGRSRRQPVLRIRLAMWRDHLARWLLAVVFVPWEALVSVDAAGRSLARLATRRHLLEWTTAAQTARAMGEFMGGATFWKAMQRAPLTALVIAVIVGWTRPEGLVVAAPFLAAWFFSPQIAYAISKPRPVRRPALAPADITRLRRLARRTWLYTEEFVGPDDRWLPPDNIQLEPEERVAHRTSPTNIGLTLLSILAAWDLGYIGVRDLAYRLRNTFGSMVDLQRYRGHFLNWYDTRTLETLPPRSVSTVDSGNLAASLLALSQGSRDPEDERVLRWASWQGWIDTAGVLAEVAGDLAEAEPDAVQALQERLGELIQKVLSVTDQPAQWIPLLMRLRTEDESLSRLISRLIEALSHREEAVKTGRLHSLTTWWGRLHHHLSDMHREIDRLTPWQMMLAQPPRVLDGVGPGSPLSEAWQDLVSDLQDSPTLGTIPDVVQALRIHLQRLIDLTEVSQVAPGDAAKARDWCAELLAKLDSALIASEEAIRQLRAISKEASEYALQMDFGFLYDETRHLFHIGYDVEGGVLNENHYDLLASEARIASLVAIGGNQVPPEHWLHLSRPLALVQGKQTLLSWSGTMFEYLMPTLYMNQDGKTLLGQACAVAVDHQIAYGRSLDVPWGISESSHYRFDANGNYHYRSFGVPDLSLRYTKEDDLVVSPYASIQALPIRPRETVDNLEHFTRLNMVGDHGLFEAVDFTPSRLAHGERRAIVRSHMVHHQGMILLALTNHLVEDIMIRRFHRDLRVECVDYLLLERIPRTAPVQRRITEAAPRKQRGQEVFTGSPWRPRLEAPLPEVHLLSNQRYTVVITDSGAGYSAWGKTALTRWRADTTCDNWGSWIYIKDEEGGELWSAAHQPVGASATSEEVVFHSHKAEFNRTTRQVISRMEVAVCVGDDVEIRRLKLSNVGHRVRRLLVSSYAEVVLAEQKADRRHPAFNKLFIEAEYLPELNALLFWRRARTAEEASVYLVHALVSSQQTIDREVDVRAGGNELSRYECDRSRFLGRGASPAAPFALLEGGIGLTNTAGATLDPIMALARSLEIAPGASGELAYVTAAASSRKEAVDLVQRYRDWAGIEEAFDRSAHESQRELHLLKLSTPQLRQIHQLLSHLLYPHEGLRASAVTLAVNSLGQTALWPYAISGDHPIVLVHFDTEEGAGLVADLLRAHAYWRSKNLLIDLVIVNEQKADYADEVHHTLQRLLARTESDPWLNRPGGIFVLRGSQLRSADRTLLETVARVVLCAGEESLEKQLRDIRPSRTSLPELAPTRRFRPLDALLSKVVGSDAMPGDAVTPDATLPRPDSLLFDNSWGGFSPDGKEYVIYLEPGQWTPAPWSNVISNPHFGFLVTETGGGFTWADNSGENRLTPWSNDPVSDARGEALYLRDEESGEVWSPTPLPARSDAPYIVRHGAGYSIFEHRNHGIDQKLRLYAAFDDPVKIVKLQLHNRTGRVRRLSATYYAEWVLGTDRDETQQYIVPEYDEARGALLATNPYSEEFGQAVAFLASSHEPENLTADRAEFLGRMGSMGSPEGLRRMGLTGTVEAGLDPCAVLQVEIELEPGESSELHFLLGQGTDHADALRLVESYKEPGQVQAAWETMRDEWERILGAVTVETLDSQMDLLLNRWLLYQDLACRVWGRSGLYQSSGAFGFRDQLQDVMALVHTAPEITRAHILEAAAHQFEEGDVLHWWHPPTGRGVRTRISDDLLWLPFVTADYVRSTGDDSILREQAPFLRGDELEPGEYERYDHYGRTPTGGTLYDHCLRAIARGSTVGSHGLPLMGAGDWNDGMSRVGSAGEGESVWLGWFLYTVLTRFAPLVEKMGDIPQARAFLAQAGVLKEALEEEAWDGEWYLRAFYDDGAPLGSKENEECQIDAIAQSWAVLSGAGGQERTMRALDAVLERLVRRKDGLALLFAPPFESSRRDPGYIKGYPPGVRENGGQYTHAAVWTVWALAALEREGESRGRAASVFRLLNPIHHGATAADTLLYRVEPYAVAADVYGVPPHTGRGGWTWYTGSAGWMYRAGLEAILGIRRVGDRLEIDPAIPPEWPSYEVAYRYGTSTYRIHVANPGRVGGGVQSIYVDEEISIGDEVSFAGEASLEGGFRLVDDGATHHVRVVLGRARLGPSESIG